MERIIDVGLPVALGVVSLLIVIALFSLRPDSPAADETPPPEQREASAEAEPARQVRPRPAEGDQASELGLAPNGGVRNQEPGLAAGDREPVARSLEEESDRTGEVELSRIGFSFAGVVGACNVELEAWTHVAVSRDLLESHPCGSEVEVSLPEPIAGREGGTFVVGDTMNPVHEHAVNIYVEEDEPAFEYGLLDGGTLRSAPAND